MPSFPINDSIDSLRSGGTTALAIAGTLGRSIDWSSEAFPATTLSCTRRVTVSLVLWNRQRPLIRRQCSLTIRAVPSCCPCPHCRCRQGRHCLVKHLRNPPSFHPQFDSLHPQFGYELCHPFLRMSLSEYNHQLPQGWTAKSESRFN